MCTVKCTGAALGLHRLLVSAGAAESGAEKAAKINTAFSSHNSDKSLYPLLIQWPLRCFWMTPGSPVSVSLSINKLKPVAAEAPGTEGCNKVARIPPPPPYILSMAFSHNFI